MSINKLLIVTTEPKSVFLEILFKFFKSKVKKKVKKKIILVGNKKIIQKEAKKINYKIQLNQINNIDNALKNKINFINIEIREKNKKKCY